MHAGAGGSGDAREEDEAGATGAPRTRRAARAGRQPPDSLLLDDSGGPQFLTFRRGLYHLMTCRTIRAAVCTGPVVACA